MSKQTDRIALRAAVLARRLEATPRQALDLPDPEDLRGAGNELTAAYRTLCQELKFTADRDVILAGDPVGGTLPPASTSPTGRSLGEVQIFSALLLAGRDPSSDLFLARPPKEVQEVAAAPATELPVSVPVSVHGMVRMTREYLAFAGTSAHERLTRGRSPLTPLLGIRYQHSDPAGWTENWSVSVQRYNRHWAMALYWGDPSNGIGELLPRLIGFASMRDPERSISQLLSHRLDGHLLIDGETGYDCTGFWDGCPLNARYQLLTLAAFTEESEIDFSGWMVAGLDRSIVTRLEEDYESLLGNDLARDVAQLVDVAEGMSLREVLDVYGLPPGHGMVRKLTEVVADMRARHEHHDRVRGARTR